MFNSTRSNFNGSDGSDDNNSEAQSYVYLNNRSGNASSVTSGISHTFGPQNDEDEIKKKVVIYNLEEPLGDERDRKNADENTVKQILITIGSASAEIQNIYRHGKPQASPRLTVVAFASENQQTNVLLNAKNLKNYPKWRGVSIKSYLAPNQRKGYNKSATPQTPYLPPNQRKGYQCATPQTPDPETQRLREQVAQMERQMEALMKNQSMQNNHQNPTVNPQMNQQYFQHQQYQQRPGYPQGYPATPHQQIPPSMIPQFSSPSPISPQNMPYSTNFGGNMQMPQYNPYGGTMTPEMAQMYQNQQNPGASQQSFNQHHANANRHGNRSQSRPRPKKTLNILVLGETGVGKSTWINGIANYMTYSTIDEAMKAGKPICLIPSKFVLYETASRRTTVKIGLSHGKKDENEVISDKGESATQDPKTYQFETPKYIVNIIDTPGIGDTRGFDQDKENTRKILNAIGQYQYLNAICFLFKANEARLTPSFRYCISELLLQLHKDAVKNIIFFFTNSSASNYKPGDSYAPLKAFLAEIERNRSLQIKLKNENTCCTDNEAFKLVCALANGIHFPADEIRRYTRSWVHSAAETNRFLDIAANLSKHVVADTVSINKARTVILHLAKPLADVNELIESNIKVMNDRKKDLYSTVSEISELKKKLKIPHIGFDVRALNYPKTVCVAEKCIDIQIFPNTNQAYTVYKQTCHDHCYLTNVDVEKYPEPHLQSCDAMAGKQFCTKCGCHWGSHMHYRFDQIKTSTEIEDKNTKDLLKQTQDANLIKEQMIKNCEIRVAELKAEQKQIIEISLRFGSFLQANAILPYNDAFEKYVEKTISQEDRCVQFGGDRSKLNNLKKLLAEYQQEKALLDKARESPKHIPAPITPDEIENYKARLFGLDQTGKVLEKLFKATEEGIAKNNQHVTVRYVPENRQNRARPRRR